MDHWFSGVQRGQRKEDDMKGFDPKFRDFPDYIIGITKEIWEDVYYEKAIDFFN